MVNLLPQAAKRHLVVEYYVRVATVWFFLLTGAMVVLGMFLVPISVLVGLQLSAYDETFTRVSADNATFGDSEKAVLAANVVASELNRVTAYAPVLDLVSTVEGLAEHTISIDGVNLERSKAGAVETITVTGEATTRAALAAFRDRIEAEPRFKSAALPISNLAKDKDVPFSIAITVNTDTP
jgi:hypothetical protein